MTPEERYEKKRKAQERADWLNNQTWEDYDKNIYDCPKCKNKGGKMVIHWVEDYEDYMQFWRPCDCIKIRV